MKTSFSLLLLLLTIACTTAFGASPIEVVNKRMAAHNNHDLEAFLACYADTIQIYDYPNLALGKPGRDHLKNIFAPLFKEGDVTTKIHGMLTKGNYVTVRVTVTREGKLTDYLSIYEVVDDRIQSVRFIR